MDVNKRVGEWFKSERESRNLTVQEVADQIDLSAVRVYQLEREGLSYQTAERHAESLGWPIPKLKAIISHTQQRKGADVVTLNTLERSSTEVERWEGDVLFSVDVFSGWLRSQFPAVEDFTTLALCSIRGDAMLPTFSEDDTLVIDTTVRAFDSDGVYVFSFGPDVFLKRIQRIPGAGVRVISDNKTLYPTYDINTQALDTLDVVARVVGKFSYKRV